MLVLMITGTPFFGLRAGGFGREQVSIALLPNDPEFARQEYLLRVKTSSAWDVVQQYTQRRDIVVAVLDTGVAIDHPDLSQNIWHNADEIAADGIDNDANSYIDDVQGWDFLLSRPDPRPKLEEGYSYEGANHGTVVAGIIAAVINNGIGVAGASLSTKIMPLRILDSSGAGNTILLTQAIDYAVENGADVINLSLIGDVRDPRLVHSIEAAYNAGVAVVAASGNQENVGVDLDEMPRYPICEEAGINHVVGVAAVDAFNTLAPFSNYGSSCIDIAAPGTNFFSTAWYIPNNPDFNLYYAGGWSGTSVAAPLVSAAIAMIKAVAPNLNLADIYRLILTNASSLQASNTNYQDLGSGMLDIKKAVDAALGLSRKKPVRIVMAPGRGFGSRVLVKDKNGVTISEFLAYGPRFNGGVSVTTGDVDGDGENEIVTVPLSQGGPHVRIFNLQGDLKGQFMAFAPDFRGGLSVAVADVDGDAKAEIIVAVLSGAGPQVRVFDGKGRAVGSFFSYDQRFRGGVKLAAGDIDNDGRAEILTAPASRGGPHIRIFDQHGGLKGQFMAFASDFRGGLTLGVGDVDYDGRNEIIVAQETDRNVQARIFDGQAQEKNRFPLFPNPSIPEQQISLLVADYTGDGQVDIITYPLVAGTSLTLFDYYGRIINTIDAAGNDTVQRNVRFGFSLTK